MVVMLSLQYVDFFYTRHGLINYCVTYC